VISYFYINIYIYMLNMKEEIFKLLLCTKQKPKAQSINCVKYEYGKMCDAFFFFWYILINDS
jgi:hypothetical protein